MQQKIRKQKKTVNLNLIKDNSESDEEVLDVADDAPESGDEDDLEHDDAEAGQDDDKNISECIRTLRFLQLLTEGHHNGLQNHLREQMTKDKVKSPYSFDFVACCSVMLGVYVKNYVNCYSTVLCNQLIEALVEFV